MLNKLKLIISELIHKLNYVNSDKTPHIEIIKNLKEKGVHVIPDFIDRETCEKLRLEADAFMEEHTDKVKLESNGSDMRVYGVDRFSSAFTLAKLKVLSDEIFEQFSWARNRQHFMLLGKIIGSDTNLGSGGGWHRDSPLRHQFKTILYLSDVTTDNGPFQYIEESHKHQMTKTVASYLNRGLDERRFKDEEIASIVEDQITLQPTTFVAQAGTVIIVDTRGLHRGKPLNHGERYALTNYHFENGVNEAFFKKK